MLLVGVGVLVITNLQGSSVSRNGRAEPVLRLRSGLWGAHPISSSAQLGVLRVALWLLPSL